MTARCSGRRVSRAAYPGTGPQSPIRSSGPLEKTFGYRVTKVGLKALEEYEKQHAKPVVRRVPLPDTVAEALAGEAWRDRRRRQYRREARDRGNRPPQRASVG